MGLLQPNARQGRHVRVCAKREEGCAELYGNAKDAKAFAVPENTKPVEEYLDNILQQLAQLPVL